MRCHDLRRPSEGLEQTRDLVHEADFAQRLLAAMFDLLHVYDSLVFFRESNMGITSEKNTSIKLITCIYLWEWLGIA